MDWKYTVFGDIKQEKSAIGRKPRLSNTAIYLLSGKDSLQITPFSGFAIIADSHKVTANFAISLNG